MQPRLHDVVINLYPNVKRITGNDVNSLEVLDANNAPISIDVNAVSTRYTQLTADYAKSQYQRDRAPEYPNLAEFADAYYWAQMGNTAPMTTWLNSVSAIKAKYPKPQE